MANDGMKIPLAIDTGMFIAGLVVAVTMWVNLNAVAEDVKELKETPVTEARVVRIESDVKHIKEAVDRNHAEQNARLDRIIEKLEDN